MWFRRHGRFFVALIVGLIAATLTPDTLGLHTIIGADLFCLTYLALMLHFATRLTPDGLRRHAGEADEGVTIVILIALAIVILSLGAVFVTFHAGQTASLGETGLALAGLPLGWAMLQTVAAFHYAGLYYGPKGQGGGLRFEGTSAPGPWEFLYYAFTVGMTAQVSDTAVTTTGMRKATLVHSVVSFFYNTVILALAVNAAVSLGG